MQLRLLAPAALVIVACGGQIPGEIDPEGSKEPSGYVSATSGVSSSVSDAGLYKTYYPGVDDATLTELYFVEMFLYKGGMQGQIRETGLHRFVSAPTFVWTASVSAQARADMQIWITEAVNTLTGGRLAPSFVDESAFEAKDGSGVFVHLDANLRALGTTDTAVTERGVIIGGTLKFETSLIDRRSDAASQVVLHEIGHLLGDTLHSGMLANLMSYNYAPANGYATYEVNAFKLLYSQEPGTLGKQLREAGVIRLAEDDVAPNLTSVALQNEPPTGSKRLVRGKVAALFGTHLNYRWGCNETYFDWPSVSLNGVPLQVLKPIVTPIYATYPGTCQLLSVNIPIDAVSGDLVVTAYGKTGNGFRVEVEN